jgi:hypothetical protein
VPRHDNNLTNHNFMSVAVTHERLKRDKNRRNALNHRHVCIHPQDSALRRCRFVLHGSELRLQVRDITLRAHGSYSTVKNDLKITLSLKQRGQDKNYMYVYIIGGFNSARKLDIRNSGQPSSTGEEGTSNEGKASWTIPHLLSRQTLCFYDLSTFAQSSP